MGTNTFHLLLAEQEAGSWKFIRNDKVPVKLGKGGINEGHITPDAMERALSTMKDFRRYADEEGVSHIRAIATSAVRSASNGAFLVDEIKRSTGIEVEVISGEREAELIWHGVKEAVQLGEETSLVVDIGGGSVEFIISNGQSILWKRSYEIGGQRMLEFFQKSDPIDEVSVAELKLWLHDKLQSLKEAVALHRPALLVGSSGSFDTLAEIDSALKNTPVNTDHIRQYTLSVNAYRELHELIVTRNREQRMQIPGMIALRVDMIVVALVLVEWLIDEFKPNRIEVSTWALKEGVLFSHS